MLSYPKIQSIFKREDGSGKRPLVLWEWSKPSFEYLKNNLWIATEKVDGTNIRVVYFPNQRKVDFRGRTDASQMYPGMREKLSALFSVEELAKIFPADESKDKDHAVCLYGEGYGGCIQEGRNYRPDESFVLFDVRIGNWWLLRKDVEDIAEALRIDVVPIVLETPLDEFLIQFVKRGFLSYLSETRCPAEGLVLTPKIPLFERNGERIITKIKHLDFVHK